MQIKNPERLFVTGRSRIVNIVDEESGQRKTNSREGGYGSWAPFKAAEFRLDQSRRGRISGSKSRLRRRLYAAPNLRERRARFASGPLRKFLCSGPFLHEPVCGTVPECPGRESLFRISQYRYAPPRGPAPTAHLASSVRLVERLQRVRLCWSSHPPSAVFIPARLRAPIARRSICIARYRRCRKDLLTHD